MSGVEGRGWGKVHKYWLPFESPPWLDSIAIDKDDVWFYTSWQFLPGLGQIKLTDSMAEFNHYILSREFRDRSIKIEKGMYRLHESWRSIGPGIATHDGYVWHGEREGITRMKWTGPSSGTGRPVTEKQALCKIHTKTHRVTRYLFPSPDEVSLNQLAYRLELDTSGRRVWGVTQRNNAFVLDTATKKLGVLTIGKLVEQSVEDHVRRRPEHILRDVIVESDGESGWIVDYNEALYLFNLGDESLLRYPLTGFHPRMVDIAPDGKVWFTSTSPISVNGKELHLPTIELGYVLCLNPKTGELITYLVPHGFSRPAGILVTNEGAVCFGIGPDRYHEGGISIINPERVKGSTTVLTPENSGDWGLMEYDVTEAEGEEIPPNTFELRPDQPIKHEYLYEYKTSGYNGFLIYTIERTPTTGRDLAQDSQGRIWFTTRRGGYLGVLTPFKFK